MHDRCSLADAMLRHAYLHMRGLHSDLCRIPTNSAKRWRVRREKRGMVQRAERKIPMSCKSTATKAVARSWLARHCGHQEWLFLGLGHATSQDDCKRNRQP